MALPASSIDGDVYFGGTQVEHATGWTSNITNDAKTFATNKTKGKVNRRPGNIDVTGTFTVKANDANQAAAYVPGVIGALKLYTSATKFYHFQDAIITSSNPVINIETGDLEAITYNWAYAGSDTNGGTITLPDGSTLDKTTYGYGT